jgi:hypothetical protein
MSFHHGHCAFPITDESIVKGDGNMPIRFRPPGKARRKKMEACSLQLGNLSAKKVGR